ncbi:class I SAM-dependent methyltransferase [Roseomonas sp. E05]|uniref:SAM-dependent methyltransferase n=1 Tax=Roseomonas sp. E05 TaxID=3046310 RepID=UPI0024BBAA8B|nr:class I SAM-dependent methyltransferase [Roseomonas sp. E05]MDJ0386792.1 class I SAM-dependent methyltransferase [Roseomonas sp. E05]
MAIEQDVAQHYTHGALERAILDALAASGRDAKRLTAADLAEIDELHLGWLAATAELAKALGLAPGMRVLDIGSGLGGPARYFADAHGCQVTGIDITPEFVAVAAALTRRCGLSGKVGFLKASALAIPLASGSFDAVTLIHVGMNVADKPRLFAEARRMLRPGGRLGAYDIVHVKPEEPLPYPMPWADSRATSFVEAPESYRRLLAEAGFTLEREEDRSELALRLGREMREQAAQHGAPPLGLHVLMGNATQQRVGNVMEALGRGIIAPVAFIARAA